MSEEKTLGLLKTIQRLIFVDEVGGGEIHIFSKLKEHDSCSATFSVNKLNDENIKRLNEFASGHLCLVDIYPDSDGRGNIEVILQW